MNTFEADLFMHSLKVAANCAVQKLESKLACEFYTADVARFSEFVGPFTQTRLIVPLDALSKAMWAEPQNQLIRRL